MRPFLRGACPIVGDYADYTEARTELISRIGSGWYQGLHVKSYCSYCERPISTMLAVEHIEPKDGPYGKPLLIGAWKNFLLACVNCNSTKKDKYVDLADMFLPDRDNTLLAFEYLKDGNVVPGGGLVGDAREMANRTLKLVGLDKAMRRTLDSSGRIIAEDRASQRMSVWGMAELFLQDYEADPANAVLQTHIVCNAVSNGFFSIWMAAFFEHPVMRQRFIDAFSGTAGSMCFDAVAAAVSPCPNIDGLPHGGKL